jgi:hypothetical protein
MNTSTLRAPIRVPAATLRLLLGEGTINHGAFRRGTVERVWPCGCSATYRFDRYDDIAWTACDKHAPRA